MSETLYETEDARCVQIKTGNQVCVNLGPHSFHHQISQNPWDYVNVNHMISFKAGTLHPDTTPSSEIEFPIIVINGGRKQMGKAIVYPSGEIRIFSSPNEIEFSEGMCGIPQISLSWIV